MSGTRESLSCKKTNIFSVIIADNEQETISIKFKIWRAQVQIGVPYKLRTMFGKMVTSINQVSEFVELRLQLIQTVISMSKLIYLGLFLLIGFVYSADG